MSITWECLSPEHALVLHQGIQVGRLVMESYTSNF